MKNKSSVKGFCVLLLGVAFEHLDMMLVSLLSSTLAIEFIGKSDVKTQLFYAYVSYAIAFIFRPIGAFIFGCIGDLYGRKKSLLSSMTMMSVATLALAFIPGKTSIGITATVLFCVCRIAQGLAVGGEYGTAMTYAYEFSPRYKTFFGACVVSSTHIGGFIATFLAGYYIDNVRRVFLIGGLLSVLILFLRASILNIHTPTAKTVKQVAIGTMHNTSAIFKAFMTAAMLVFVFYSSFIYVNDLAHQQLHVAQATLFYANAFILALWIVIPPCIGYAADKKSFSYIKIMQIGALGVLFSAPFLGLAFYLSSYPMVFFAQLIIQLFHMLFCLCTPRFFGDLFKSTIRNTAVSTSYSLGASITAALAPMICYISIELLHSIIAISIPFMLFAISIFYLLSKEDVCHKMIRLSYTT